MNLKKIISQGESETVEFKKSPSESKEIIKTISAFANTKGGKIFVGVSNSGKVLGVEIGKDTIERLVNQITQNTDPKVHPHITVEKIDEKQIIVIKVKESSDHLVLAFGRPYKRVGKSTLQMSKDEYERSILEKHKDKLYFDSQICEEATLADIDKEKIKWFLKEGKRQGRVNISIDAPIDEILVKLRLLKNSKPTNSAILLFGKNVEQFFIQSEIKCILLSTSTFSKPYASYQTYLGNLFEQTEKATHFILENIRKPLWLESGKISASSSYEVPEEAIREAIVNAIVHRDYASPSKIQIRVFPDRIEVWNPGRLPSQLRIEDLKKPHPSVPYNPLIFRQFYRVGFVEDVGGGTTDIIEWCKKAGLLEPEFEQGMGFFIIKIERATVSDEVLEKFGLNERQIESVKYIEKYGRITRAEYEKLSHISARTASRELEELYKKKVIEKKGKGPAVYYLLARSGEIWRDKGRKKKNFVN